MLKLQASQLANAHEVFRSSVERIDHDLDRIAGRVVSMTEASSTLLGCSTDERDSFFLEMERRLTAILKIIRACVEVETETRSAVSDLTVSAARMRESVAEVREIEIRIRRIAINAAIRAVQIGEAGNALDVLAGIIQKLALDTGRITDVVAGSLDRIAEAAGCLSSGSEDAGSAEGESVGKVRETLLELHSASERSFSRLNQIAVRAARLRDGIRSVRAGFSASAQNARAIHEAQRTLDELCGSAGSPEDTGAHLEHLAAHYTMEAEREVHASVTAGVAPARSEPADAPGDAEAGEFGDNVELF